ncbi:MAG: putative toxin-antitoxin system toxin component, PIN family [Methanobacteriota archaeon]
MADIRAIYDTNVLVSALNGQGPPYMALRAVYREKVRLVISPEILFEFEEVLSRPKFPYSQEQIKEILAMTIKISEVVHPKSKVNLVKDDPDDNKVIEAAIAGKAGYIVTGDKHLLTLKRVRGIEIITPKDFIQRLVE